MLKDKTLSSFRIVSLLIIYFFLYLFLFQDVLGPMISSKFGQNGVVISLLSSNIILLIVFFIVCWKYYAFSFEKFFENTQKNIYAVILAVVALFLTEIIVGNFISVVFPQAISDNQTNNEAILNTMPAGFIFISVICAPIIEETIFRGCLFSKIREKHSFLLSASISAFVFGFLHIVASLLSGNLYNCVYFILYALCGFILCIPYEDTETIASSIFTHMLCNFISVVIVWIH